MTPLVLRGVPSARYVAQVAIGAAAIVGTAWLLSPGIGKLLASEPVSAFDRYVATALRADAGSTVHVFMILVSDMHGNAGILSMAAVVAAWLIWRRRASALPVLVASVSGGLMLNGALKNVVQRARPDSLLAYERLATFSFPSGHTAGASVFYGFVAVLLWKHLLPTSLTALLVAFAAMIALVGASRIMLGVHYASDCVAAVLEGLLWVAICVAGQQKALVAPGRVA